MNWSKLITCDCVVARIGSDYLLPIFRNGSTSILSRADKLYTNKQITKLDVINVFIQDPEKRFVSGINEYSRQNNLDLEDTWQKVHDGILVDRHFAPQYIWLLHLSKHYNGHVRIMDLKQLKKYCDVHSHKSKRSKPVAVLRDFVAKDYHLMDYKNRVVPLEKLVKEYGNALS